MQGEGLADFKVWPDYPRDEYHAIIYLQPADHRNQRAIGYDMFTESVRREAMEARATLESRLLQEESFWSRNTDPQNQAIWFSDLRAGLQQLHSRIHFLRTTKLPAGICLQPI